MSKKCLYDQRVEMYLDVLHHKKTKRVPSYLMMDALYAVQFMGEHSVKAATYDARIVLEASEKMLNQVKCDGVGNIYTKGGMFYRASESKNFIQSKEGFLQHPEIHTLEAEELDGLIDDPFAAIANKVFPRALGKMREPFPMNMYSMIKANMGNDRYLGDLVAGKFGVAKRTEVPMVYTNLTKAPLDYLGSSVRGLVGILKDMRKYPEKIIKACEVMEPLLEATGEIGFRAPNRDFPFIFMPTLIPHFIKSKDFEKFYFPTFKKMICNLADKGFNFVIQFEGNWERFYDYLQDLPKNKIFGIFEFGDPQLAKDKLGKTMAVSGFYPLTLLGMGRPQECVDKAKEIVDILAPGGGYIFTTDKQIMNVKDAIPENLIQVYNFVNNCTAY